MSKSKSWISWKTWVYPGIPSVLLTLLGMMFPNEAKALGAMVVAHWNWIGPLLALASYIVLVSFVFRDIRRMRATSDKANRRSRRANKRVRRTEDQLRDQTTRIGAAVDRIETLERKVIDRGPKA